MKIRPSTTALWIGVIARVRPILGVAPIVLCLLVLCGGASSALAAPAEKTGVTNVTIGGDKARTVVTIKTTKRPTYSVRVADKGSQLLVELSGAVIRGAPAAILDRTDIVGGVMTQTFDNATTRVSIRLASQATYSVNASDEGMTVTLTPAEKTTAASTKAPSAEPAKVETPTLRDVRFEHRTGKDVVTIELNKSVKYETKSTETTSRLELKGVAVSAKLERTLDVAAFRGSVRSVSTFKKDDLLVIEVDRAPDAKSFVSEENGVLTWSFTTGELSSSETGKGADGGAARRSKTISREELPEDLPKIETRFVDDPLVREVEPERADAFLPSMAGQVATPGAGVADAQDSKQVRTNGRRIDVDLKDADIHDVLRLIADVGRVNIVTADNVSGSVTIRLRNVPWDQALETVLQAKGLGLVRRGNLIRVATLADLNKERELALARRKSEFQLAPLETRLIPISYANAADLMDRAKDLQSPRGSLAVDERTNVIIARDVTGNLNQIEELVRALDTQTPQVLIEARIVEASSRFTRDVGIQWGGDAVMSQGTGNDTGVAFPNSIGIAGGARGAQQNIDEGFRGASPNYVVNLPAAAGPGSGGALSMLFGSVDGNFNIGVRLSAAESSGLIRIVSSPRILTLDNKTARISTGTLIPYSQIGAQGVQTSFQEAKLQLLVTPHVTADGSVSMQVRVNRDTPDFGQTGPRGEPTIRKREAETELLVQDGHTAVIGGIYQRNMSRGVDQVPLLGDIPILGVIFQHRTATDDREELVIFITPRIVNRAEALGR